MRKDYFHINEPISFNILSNYIKNFNFFIYQKSSLETENIKVVYEQKRYQEFLKEPNEIFSFLISFLDSDWDAHYLKKISISSELKLDKSVIYIFYYMLLFLSNKEIELSSDKSFELKKLLSKYAKKIENVRLLESKFEKNFYKFLTHYSFENISFDDYLYTKMLEYLRGNEKGFSLFCKEYYISKEFLIFYKLVQKYIKDNHNKINFLFIEEVKNFLDIAEKC